MKLAVQDNDWSPMLYIWTETHLQNKIFLQALGQVLIFLSSCGEVGI